MTTKQIQEEIDLIKALNDSEISERNRADYEKALKLSIKEVNNKSKEEQVFYGSNSF